MRHEKTILWLNKKKRIFFPEFYIFPLM